MPRFKRVKAPKYTGKFRPPTLTRLAEWIAGCEGWSVTNGRNARRWLREHGWIRKKKGKGAWTLANSFWVHPNSKLLPHHLGGQVYAEWDAPAFLRRRAKLALNV